MAVAPNITRVRIPLVNGGEAVCDLRDYPKVRGIQWRSTGRYAAAYCGEGVTLMHRVIAKPGDGMFVDHINSDGFDNRRANLRVCTAGENVLNRRKLIRKTSRFKGVFRIPERHAWRAKICADGVSHYLGNFQTEAEAARAYDRAALRLHGRFAKTNAMLGLYTAIG